MVLEQTKSHNFAARPWRGASSHNFFIGAFPPAHVRGRSARGLDAPVQLPSQLCQGTENTQQAVGPNKAQGTLKTTISSKLLGVWSSAGLEHAHL